MNDTRYEWAARPVSPRSSAELVSEWDRLAADRRREIESGSDLSYSRVLVPTVLALASAHGEVTNVLDVGSGTGDLTRMLASNFSNVTGVEPSRASIALARTQRLDDHAAAPRFVESTIEDFARWGSDVGRFDLAIANMVLMDTPDLYGTLSAIAMLLRPGAAFVWTITHPWFWPAYWGYSDAPWFHYDSEIYIEAKFRTSTSRSAHSSTHIHRPLSRYIECLRKSGFGVDEILEPMPTGADLAAYPSPWSFPRFLAARCVLERAESSVHER